MSEGYVYCFSNPSMPNILKIGMTERTPIERLNEANASDTWRPPTPYKIEFAKRVNNPKMKEYMIHKLLSELSERINPKREFFRNSVEEVNTIFNLIEGEWWEQTKDDNKENDEYEEIEETPELYIRKHLPIEGEEWKICTVYPEYSVSNMGRVRITDSKEIVRTKHSGKFLCVKISNYILNLHTLVGELFIPNPEFKSYVRHINGNTKDNRVENLEWAKRNNGTVGRPKKVQNESSK